MASNNPTIKNTNPSPVGSPSYNSMNVVSRLTANLLAEDYTTLSGEDFTPKITTEPAFVSFKTVDGEVQGLSWNSEINGSYYDIVVYSTELFTDIKIDVLC